MLSALLLLPLLAQDGEALTQRLAQAADLPDPRERQSAARALAEDEEVSLEAWLQACRSLPPRSAPASGLHELQLELYADGKLEETPVAVYVPKSYRSDTPAPLMLVLHGTGGEGKGLLPLWREWAEKLGMLLVAPTETQRAGGYGFTQRERDISLSALHWAKREYRVDSDRVFVTGISRGGHLSWDLALRHPDLWAGVAPMIGGPYWNLSGGRANLRYIENVLPLHLVDIQGAMDDAGLVWNVRFAFEELERLGAEDARYIEIPDMGHSVDMSAVDWDSWFAAARRPPRPDHIVRATARKGEGRSFWIEVTQNGREVTEEFVPRISAKENARLDEEGRRRWLIAETAKRTGRVEARLLEPGHISIDMTRGTKLRLYLEADMLTERGGLTVDVRGKHRRFHPTPSARVLLSDFVERLDPGFLPTAKVDLRR